MSTPHFINQQLLDFLIEFHSSGELNREIADSGGVPLEMIEDSFKGNRG